MSIDLEHVNCNLCGGHNTKHYAISSYSDYINRRFELRKEDDPVLKDEELANYKFNLVKCKNCGLIYVNPRLRKEKLEKLYTKEYFSHYLEIEGNSHKKRQMTFKIEIEELEGLAKKLKLDKKILDIGCGGGFFLNSLDESWIKKVGIEVNQVASEYGKKNFNLDIFSTSLEETNFQNEMFDVIILRSVIEHLPDPSATLNEVYRVLQNKGLIMINTPNIGGVCGKLYREKFRMVCPTHHIYYFSTRTLLSLLEKSNFKIFKVYYHYFRTSYANWRDPLKILYDFFTFKIYRDPYVTCPPFYGNTMTVYAIKERK